MGYDDVLFIYYTPFKLLCIIPVQPVNYHH